jgi:hypothetical protein
MSELLNVFSGSLSFIKKSKVSLCLFEHQDMKTWGGQLYVYFGSKWRWVVSFIPKLLSLFRKELPVPIG